LSIFSLNYLNLNQLCEIKILVIARGVE